MKKWIAGLIFICLYTNVSSQKIKIAADNSLILYHGRTITKNGTVELISSASYAEFRFSGDSCVLGLSNVASPGDYNYVAVEIDNEYKGRIKIADTNVNDYIIVATKKSLWHLLRVYKATEAQNGLVVINYIKALKLKAVATHSKKKIEFIGNSITCGFGNDDKEIPCNNGSKWYDQHNAYWSYASRVARSVDADFVLSTISGAGVYRNWNSDGPTVPQQYESAYLRIDSAERWNFKNYIPDIVTVALGTNDLSGGDGKTPRNLFDSTIFINTYINFLKTIYHHYPATQIILLTSPMVNGKNAERLLSCLKIIQTEIFKQKISQRKIKIFKFKPMHATGCDGHPSMHEHETMADELLPFIKQAMKELN